MLTEVDVKDETDGQRQELRVSPVQEDTELVTEVESAVRVSCNSNKSSSRITGFHSSCVSATVHDDEHHNIEVSSVVLEQEQQGSERKEAAVGAQAAGTARVVSGVLDTAAVVGIPAKGVKANRDNHDDNFQRKQQYRKSVTRQWRQYRYQGPIACVVAEVMCCWCYKVYAICDARWFLVVRWISITVM